MACPSCRSSRISSWANFQSTIRRPATCPDCKKQFYRRHYVYGAVEAVLVTCLLVGLFIVFVTYGGVAAVATGIGIVIALLGIWGLEVQIVRLRELTDVKKNDAAVLTLICQILLCIGVLALVGTLAYEILTI